jgi:hypothetical protein
MPRRLNSLFLLLSGTPFVGNEDQSELQCECVRSIATDIVLFASSTVCLSFLKFKDQDDGKTAWENEGKQLFLDGMDRDKILCALREIMVMHRKEDLFHSRDVMVSHN